MAFPILEGVSLLNAAKGLISELRGHKSSAASQTTGRTVQIPQSTFAAMLQSQLQSQGASSQKAADSSSTTTTATGPIRTRIDELISQYQAALTDFQNNLGGAFSNSFIDTTQPLDLTMDADGNVTVANDNPNAEQINNLFAAHPMLRYGFARLASQASMIETSLDTFPPGLRYFGDPAGAVTQMGTLLTGQNAPSQFHLVVGGENVIRSYFGTDPLSTSKL